MSDTLSVQDLVTRGVTAARNGEMSIAFKALTEALARDPQNELAWLWLSHVCKQDAYRKFCMERILEINPAHESARMGLDSLPLNTRSENPLPKHLRQTKLGKCEYPGCSNTVSNSKHKYCRKHWIETQTQKTTETRDVTDGSLLFATALGEKLGLSSRRINQILAELGWITPSKKGWIPSLQGKSLGAMQRQYSQTGIPFVLWPPTIVENKVLVNAIQDFKGERISVSNVSSNELSDFRSKFPAKHRATDGHWVRSRAELLIDNWLYMAGIVHAYERQLPIEEEAYCDFYIPAGKVYVEYWGLERDSQYQARMSAKRELYAKHNFNLIELTDEHIRNLDDALPKMLLQYNIETS